ncbi:hypothetical protein CDAR_581251 [Caerostris darwini]|uniref:Uncharacterized protein n=1 Tax=Caerostris darwini TaxID=1538125 RepID=A0AAV4PLA9_9ARAC|nr:hypothetical protein CDAR_581251 [Caerostris darwini]
MNIQYNSSKGKRENFRGCDTCHDRHHQGPFSSPSALAIWNRRIHTAKKRIQARGNERTSCGCDTCHDRHHQGPFSSPSALAIWNRRIHTAKKRSDGRNEKKALLTLPLYLRLPFDPHPSSILHTMSGGFSFYSSAQKNEI